MEQVQSVAQNLPYPILSQIIEYAADFHSVSQINSIYLARPRIGIYLQLTRVCHSWRSMMLQTLCRDNLLILTSSDSCDIYGYRLWPVNQEFGKYPLDNLVKTVRLVCDYCIFRNGVLLEKLASEPYNNLVFPSATTLRLVFSDCHECEYADKHNDMQIASKYTEAIRKMIPNFENIMVESKPNLTGLDGRVGSAYEVLPELFTKTKSSMFSLFDSSFIEYIEIPNYSNSLTHLAFGGDIEDERIMQLVQSNAQSLQILEMMHIMNGNIAELLQSEEGDDQIFPQLRKLHLRKNPTGQVLRRVEITEAVVFPSLKWLSIDMPYPLADDTFLRGNAGTLEYLEMQIDTESIDMLRNFNVFQKNRFANLKHLKLRSAITGDDENNNMVLGNISLQMFLQGISETPRRLCIDGFSVFEELMESISQLPSMNSLRVLNIMDTRVSLSQIPEMLSRLPFLEELAIGYTADFGPMFRQVPLDDLPQYISSRFSSMSPHLWKLNQSFDEDDISLETFASYAVMMKIMCPSLTRVMAPDTIQKEYREIIQTEITKPYLQTHKKDLLVLLRAMPKILVRLI